MVFNRHDKRSGTAHLKVRFECLIEKFQTFTRKLKLIKT